MIPSTAASIHWSSGTWLNPPRAVTADGAELIITAAEGSDFWRTTAYDFVHDDGHALLRPFDVDTAVEVTFRLDYDRQFDQAGVLVRADARHWVKSGVEFADGVLRLGAVVTHEVSDWSMRPVPDWAGGEVTVRISRAGDALTIRAREKGADWDLVRVAPWAPGLPATAGPYCCAPTRAGLSVRFLGWRIGPADDRLHE